MKIFVSSTYEDLSEHRRAVEDSFLISGIQFNAMEHFGSTPRPSITTCLNAVAISDTFVGIVGVRYGESPPHTARSYTEREYRKARAQGMPALMFLIDERNASVPAHYVTRETAVQQDRLKKLKAVILNNHTVTFFKTPEDLARLVLASIIREFGVVS